MLVKRWYLKCYTGNNLPCFMVRVHSCNFLSDFSSFQYPSCNLNKISQAEIFNVNHSSPSDNVRV